VFDLPPPSDDGLLIPDVKPWSADKHYFLRRFVDGFTTAMRDKWPELHYVDLFAGAGIERVEGLGLDWGSPLIAAQAPYNFTRLHLCELDADKFRALSVRVAGFGQPQPPQLIHGDANSAVKAIVPTLPARALSLAFLDPYGLHLHYRSVAGIAARKVDLIIFFPDHLDALRNWEAYYADDPESNLDLFLGTGEWRTRKAQTPPDRWVDVLREIYEAQLRKLGYTEFEYERIRRTDGRPLYRLIFCSRDKAGGKIWRGISHRSPDGQGQFQW
jgi:three-Cys-motif partner protein